MRKTLYVRLLGTAQLTRLAMAVGAIGDVWFTVLFSRGIGEYSYLNVVKMSPTLALAIATVVAAGLFTFGASLNDLLDARHDRTFSPEKPIPAGYVRPATVGIVVAIALIVSLLGALFFGIGALALTLIVAIGILFYNVLGKHVPAIGVIAVGVVSALHMLIPNYEMTFTLPIWLTMTHSMAITLSIYMLVRKRPYLSRRSYAVIAISYLSWSTIILIAGWHQQDGLWPRGSSSIGILWPVLAILGFVLLMRLKTKKCDNRIAAEKLARYGAMWQSIYAGCWLLAVGMYEAALLLFALALVGFCLMTAMKEFGGLITSPPRYQI
jgi:4-hydroxybenzoate polyprenyltransferase